MRFRSGRPIPHAEHPRDPGEMSEALARAAFARGRELHQAGQLKAARSAYREAIAHAPGHAEALHLLGTAPPVRVGAGHQAAEALLHLRNRARRPVTELHHVPPCRLGEPRAGGACGRRPGAR